MKSIITIYLTILAFINVNAQWITILDQGGNWNHVQFANQPYQNIGFITSSTSVDFRKTTNSGQTWSQLTFDPNNSDTCYSFSFTKDGNIGIGITQAGKIKKTMDGGRTWVLDNNPLINSSSLFDCWTDGSIGVVVGINHPGNKKFQNPDDAAKGVILVNPNILINDTWSIGHITQEFSTQCPIGSVTGTFDTENGQYVIFAVDYCGRVIYQNIDNTLFSWKETVSNVPIYKIFYDVTVDEMKPDTAYIAGIDFNYQPIPIIHQYPIIYRTYNRGEDWIRMPITVDNNPYAFTSIAISGHQFNHDLFTTGFTGFIFRSSDVGYTWVSEAGTPVNAELRDISFTANTGYAVGGPYVLKLRDPFWELFVNAGIDTLIQCGDSIILGGDPTARGGVPYHNEPHYRYSWSSIPFGFTSEKSNPYVTPTVSTYYIVTVTDSINQIATDTILVSVNGCNTWPRYINNFPESFRFACNDVGDLLATFETYDTLVSFGQGDVFYDPYGFSLAFINKYSNILWFHSLWTGDPGGWVEQLSVDDKGNSYVLILSRKGYNFSNGPSMTIDDHCNHNLGYGNWKHYLAKIDMQGDINWVLAFASPDTSTCSSVNYAYGLPINSFSVVGDSIYLAGFSQQSSVWTGKTGNFTHWDLGNNTDFICTVKRSNGDVVNLTSFSSQPGEITSSPNFITYLHDTILVVQADFFYLFNLESVLIKTPPEKVFNGSLTHHGWLNNGDNKIITLPLACAEDINGEFSPPKWETEIDSVYSGFVTSNYLYFLYRTPMSYPTIKKLNLGDGSIVGVDTIPNGTGQITGNKNLSFGYSVSWIPNGLFDTIKIDTFGLPNGIPKSKLISPNQDRINNYYKTSIYGRDIAIFPNPTERSFSIIVGSDFKDKLNSIEVFSTIGVLVKRIITLPNILSYKVDLTGYSDGIYFVIVKTDDETFTKKVVKLE